VIKKGKTTVADIGSGTGVMGFLASQLGAKDVYMYEYGDVIGLSQKIAEDNGIENLHFINAHSSAVENPPQVDVIVSETLGNFAHEEHIIAIMADARRFLKPGGTVIPQRVDQFVCPVVSDRFHKELCAWDDVGLDIDYAAAKAMSFNNIYVRAFRPDDLLDGGRAVRKWDSADLQTETDPNRAGQAEWVLEKDAVIYGFAVWWNCELLPGIDLGTSPLSPATHWEQLYFPVLEPVAGKKGDSLAAALASQSSYEEGTIVSWDAALTTPQGKTSRQSFDLTQGYLG
jgi:protein arginine N-methyltransferase 1